MSLSDAKMKLKFRVSMGPPSCAVWSLSPETEHHSNTASPPVKLAVHVDYGTYTQWWWPLQLAHSISKYDPSYLRTSMQ